MIDATKNFTETFKKSLTLWLNDDECESLDMMAEYADEIEFIRKCLLKLNIHASHPICWAFWRDYSFQSDAGWLTCVDETEVINEAKRILN